MLPCVDDDGVDRVALTAVGHRNDKRRHGLLSRVVRALNSQRLIHAERNFRIDHGHQQAVAAAVEFRNTDGDVEFAAVESRVRADREGLGSGVTSSHGDGARRWGDLPERGFVILDDFEGVRGVTVPGVCDRRGEGLSVSAPNAHLCVVYCQLKATDYRHADGDRALGEFTGFSGQQHVHAVSVLERKRGVLIGQVDPDVQRGGHGHVVRRGVFTDAEADLERRLPRFRGAVPEFNAPIGGVGCIPGVSACGVHVFELGTVVGHVHGEFHRGVFVFPVLLGKDVHTAFVVGERVHGQVIDGTDLDEEVTVCTAVQGERQFLTVCGDVGEGAAFVAHVEGKGVLHRDHVRGKGDATGWHQEAQAAIGIQGDVP